MRLLGLLGALTLGACAGAPQAPVSALDGPAPASREAPRPVEAGLPPLVLRHGELAELLASRLAPAKTCREVANTLDSYISAHQTELGPATAALDAWERSAPDFELRAFYRRFFPAIEVRIAAGERCHRDAAAHRAFDRFFSAAGLD